MRRLLLIFFAFLSFALPLTAQAKRPFTFEDMMKLKRVADPQVSPDGKWVIFSVVDVDLAANTKTPHVWIVPPGSPPPQNANSSPIRTPTAPAGRRMASASRFCRRRKAAHKSGSRILMPWRGK